MVRAIIYQRRALGKASGGTCAFLLVYGGSGVQNSMSGESTLHLTPSRRGRAKRRITGKSIQELYPLPAAHLKMDGPPLRDSSRTMVHSLQNLVLGGAGG